MARVRQAAAQRSKRAAKGSRSRLASWIAGGVAFALVGTIAVVSAGYDARETPREEPSVWAMRSAGQYARVNTLTAEIDTVRKVEDPTGIAQSGAGSVVFSHGNGRAWSLDAASPGNLIDVDESGAAGPEGPEGPEEGDGQAGEGNGEGSDAHSDGELDPELDAESAVEADAGGSEDAADVVESEAPAIGDDSGPTAMRTPDGTRDIVSSDAGVVFRTDGGQVFFSPYEAAAPGLPQELGAPRQLDPLESEREERSSTKPDAAQADDSSSDPEAAGEEPAGFIASAVAFDADGNISILSVGEQSVRTFDVHRDEFVGGLRAVPAAALGDDLQFTTVAGKWVLLNAESATLWREGLTEPVRIDAEGETRLQAASPRNAGEEVLIADEGGLWAVSKGVADRVEATSGLPAQPATVGDARYAAWLGSDAAWLWSSEDGVRALEIDEAVGIPSEPEPVIRSNGTNGLISEVKTGMMWTLPEGTLIPVEQWTLADPPKERDGTVVVNDVTEQEPPVAVTDTFGVRSGEQSLLPVLLNDYDPNRKDVLTIVTEGLGGDLDPAFGEVSVLPDAQSLSVMVAPGAEGTASFSYRITDGGLTSEPTQVTLNVVGPDTNSAPEWCAVEGCQRDWPSPELAPGGTLVLPILEGWVDPEGDPMMLESATPVDSADPVRAIVTADGRLAVRHTDPNAPDSDVLLRLRVTDARSAATEHDLRIQIRSNAKAEMALMAATVQTDQPSSVRPLERITGGSGSFAMVDATVQSGSMSVAVNPGAGTVEVTAQDPGVSLIVLSARDTVTGAEISGTVRVTAVASRAKLGLPPLRAFVRPLADTTVDVLDAVPGANSRALVVNSASIVDGELRADVIEHARVRVSGSTPDGAPGRIGAVDVGISEGNQVSTGRLTVFQVPDAGSAGAIAVADAVTVRAGSIADIHVLDNDVAAPGQRLVLHPEVTGSGAKGELAFASGNTLRYLAPNEPGTYTLSYTTYSASSPEASDAGQVRVTVVPREGNRDPQPRTLTVRVAPGERATMQVPLSGVDPDGDRVRLVGVSAPDDAQISATLAPRSSAVQIEASKQAGPGQHVMKYTVRDEFGGSANGTLRVIVTDSDPSAGAPITYSDYVRLVAGANEPAIVQPLNNDIDPADGTLEIVEVVPNVPGGKESAQYRELAARLDTSALKRGRVSIAGGTELGTVSYRYTVRSSESTSTADGLIVVQVSARVGQQAPTVNDTVLSARDRAELQRGGVDVVTDRVYWAAGDVQSLQMSVWGSAADRFSAKGNRIVGSYRAEGDLVPFKLTGTDLTGAEVESFGFLVIPPLDELRLTLKPGLSPIRADEGKSVDIALSDVLDLGQDDTAELRSGSFATQRGQAACEARGSGSFSYSAGKEAPWNDSCVIDVKLTEQSAWTSLAVPIEIVPSAPVAELETLTRTVAPGASEAINLLDMVRWQGGREGRPDSLAFAVSGGGDRFEVAHTGTQVTVQARADASPGAQDSLAVSVTGAGDSQAPLTLRVGEAAKDTPRGATVQLTCTVGGSCQAPLIGAAGEYDPFQGKTGGGLTLAGVNGGSCAVGTLEASGNSVSVSWPNGPKGAGGKCTATFSVRDAQNRVGEGSIELDAQGVPRPPTGISSVGYDGNSVTLEVTLSGEASHPATTGVRVLKDGVRQGDTCSGSGATFRCVVSNLNNGEKHSFSAVAVNSVGDSDPTVNAVVAWAYAKPSRPNVIAEQVSAESPATGTVSLKITGDSSTRAFKVISPAGETMVSGSSGTARISGLSVGQPTITVIPLSAHEPPAGDSADGASWSRQVKVTGRPTVSVAPGSSEQGTDKATVIVTVDSGGAGNVKFNAVPAGQSCTPENSGTSGEIEVTGTTYQKLTVTACAENEWGAALETASTTVDVGGVPNPPTVESGFAVGAHYRVDGVTAVYDSMTPPDVKRTNGHTLDFRVDGVSVGETFPATVSGASSYSVAQCMNGACSTPAPITGTAPVSVDLSGCFPSTASQHELLQRISPHARASAIVAYDPIEARFTVMWTGTYGHLDSLNEAVCAAPEPGDPANPDTP